MSLYLESEARWTSAGQAFSQPCGYTSRQACNGSAKEKLASGCSSWQHLPSSGSSAHHSAMGMTAHLLDDTFITAKELAKGPEIGGWKAILEKNICTNPLKSPKFPSCHFNEGQKQISPSSITNGLNPARKSRERKLVAMLLYVHVAQVILGRD